MFRILGRWGLNRLASLEPAAPAQRYEHAAPGDLIHLDIKKLGRFSEIGRRITGDRSRRSRGLGWEFLHVAIDDHSRVAFSNLLADERSRSAIGFLKSVVARYRALGVEVRRVLTDNGSCYRSGKFRRACRRPRLKHIFTKPYTPRTNGKAERFIPTARREWAYSTAYQSSVQRPIICRAGYIATTGIGPMGASLVRFPSADSASTGTTYRDSTPSRLSMYVMPSELRVRR